MSKLTAVAAPEWAWRITWGDVTFTDDDLLAEDMAGVQLLLQGDGWAQCDPTKGPLQLMATITVVVARLTGRDVVEVRTEVAKAKAITLLSALDVAEPQAA